MFLLAMLDKSETLIRVFQDYYISQISLSWNIKCIPLATNEIFSFFSVLKVTQNRKISIFQKYPTYFTEKICGS